MIDTAKQDEAEVWVSRGTRRYGPGERISGAFRTEAWRAKNLQAIEFSLLWHTAGEGEEDFCVHHFRRMAVSELPDDDGEVAFEATLPLSPHSYDGQIVKVCWVARLRGFFAGGKQRIVEAPFWLTEQPDAEAPEPMTPPASDDGGDG